MAPVVRGFGRSMTSKLKNRIFACVAPTKVKDFEKEGKLAVKPCRDNIACMAGEAVSGEAASPKISAVVDLTVDGTCACQLDPTPAAGRQQCNSGADSPTALQGVAPACLGAEDVGAEDVGARPTSPACVLERLPSDAPSQAPSSSAASTPVALEANEPATTVALGELDAAPCQVAAGCSLTADAAPADWQELGKYMYDASQPLASGGEGDLYRGYVKGKPDVAVALKLEHWVGTAKERVARARFHRALRGVRGLVQLLDWKELPEEGRTAHVLNFVPGKDLAAYLRPGGASAEEVQRLVEHLPEVGRQLFQVLKRLHARQVYHGDVKPENVRLAWTPSGLPVVTLLDLGCAGKFSWRGRTCDRMFGSFPYLAPELAAHLDSAFRKAPPPHTPAAMDVWAATKMLLDLRSACCAALPTPGQPQPLAQQADLAFFDPVPAKAVTMGEVLSHVCAQHTAWGQLYPKLAVGQRAALPTRRSWALFQPDYTSPEPSPVSESELRSAARASPVVAEAAAVAGASGSLRHLLVAGLHPCPLWRMTAKAAAAHPALAGGPAAHAEWASWQPRQLVAAAAMGSC